LLSTRFIPTGKIPFEQSIIDHDFAKFFVTFKNKNQQAFAEHFPHKESSKNSSNFCDSPGGKEDETASGISSQEPTKISAVIAALGIDFSNGVSDAQSQQVRR